MAFEFLERDAIDQIVDVIHQSGLSEPNMRSLLFNGIDRRYEGNLRRLPQPRFQVISDLNALRRCEQLSDGTVPFATWLRNAIGLLPDPEGDDALLLGELLDEIERQRDGRPPSPRARAATETKEQILVDNDMVPYGFLSAGATAGQSVGRLQVPQIVNGQPVNGQTGKPLLHRGTGWLISSTLLVTNHHVINARLASAGQAAPIAAKSDLALQAADAELMFDFNDTQVAGSPVQVVEVVASNPAAELDYAILRVAESARKPLLLRRERLQSERFAVNIIQHPEGGPKQVALRNNLVTGVEPRTLHYLTDTLGGSSGSPVFDDTWTVVALHRGSRRKRTLYNGKSVAYVNVGTPLPTLLADLQTRAPEIYAEIIC